MNSRYNVVASRQQFGSGGIWSHNYQWHIPTQTYPSTMLGDDPPMPTNFSVYYPDGRVTAFSKTTQDTAYRAPAGSGISDRFQYTNPHNGSCYLLLPDEGKVRFYATAAYTYIGGVTGEEGYWTISFSVTGIIDPHGRTLSISYPADGSMMIKEPAGRCLKVFYVSFNGKSVVDRVEERADTTTTTARRTVKYYYLNYNAWASVLDKVVYFGDASLTATYKYQNSNISGETRPLIWKCVDPMFDGPMWRIAYKFAPYATGVVHGQLLSENYLDAALNVGAADVFSITNERGHITKYWRDTSKRIIRIDYPTGAYETFTYNSFGQVLSHRMTNGGSESFVYDTRGLLQTHTNGDNKVTTVYHDADDRISQIVDPRGNTTWFLYNRRGQVTEKKNADQSRQTFVYNITGTVASSTDELNHTTQYTTTIISASSA